MAIVNANWYDYPAHFDLAFRSETALEADFIEAACRKYCPFQVRSLLEPACGTGRGELEEGRHRHAEKQRGNEERAPARQASLACAGVAHLLVCSLSFGSASAPFGEVVQRVCCFHVRHHRRTSQHAMHW